MIPSITNGEIVGNEVQFTTNSGLRPVTYGTKVTDTDQRSFSVLDDQNVIVSWGQFPSTLRSYDPDNSWVENWSWASASNEDIVATYKASDGFVYFTADNNTLTQTKVYKVDGTGVPTLVYTHSASGSSDTTFYGAFGESSSGVHVVLRDSASGGTYIVRNLTTGNSTGVYSGSNIWEPSLIERNGTLFLFLRDNSSPYVLRAYAQIDAINNTWSLIGQQNQSVNIGNFSIISTPSKFYSYINLGSAVFPNKLFESTNLLTWTEVVDFGSRLPTNSIIVQNDSLSLPSDDYIIIKKGQPAITDDTLAYAYYVADDKLVPAYELVGHSESGNLDFNEVISTNISINVIQSGTAYPVVKYEGNEIEYSVSAFTDTTFNIDLGATPSIGEYTLYWIDGSSSSISIGTPVINEVTDTGNNTITEATQGQIVKVKGTNFLAPRTLYFDAVSQSIISESDTEIEFQVPIDATIGPNDIYIDSNGNLSNTIQLTINPAIVDPQDYTLSANGQDFPIQYIEEGYESSIELPWSQVVKENLQVRAFDDGATYDVYKCKFSAVMQKADYDNLMLVYRDNKDLNFTLVAQNGGAGFSPFTPAYGDQGTFTFKINQLKQSGTLDDERYQWFRVSFDIVNSGALPSYSPSVGNNEGTLQIGTIGGLRYPIGGYSPIVNFDTSAVGLATSTAYAQSWENDDQKSKMKLRLLFDKMSLLLKHLLSERTNQIAILVPSGHYPFGAEGGDNQSFNTRLITKVLKVKQIKNTRYEINLEFQRVINE